MTRPANASLSYSVFCGPQADAADEQPDAHDDEQHRDQCPPEHHPIIVSHVYPSSSSSLDAVPASSGRRSAIVAIRGSVLSPLLPAPVQLLDDDAGLPLGERLVPAGGRRVEAGALGVARR